MASSSKKLKSSKFSRSSYTQPWLIGLFHLPAEIRELIFDLALEHEDIDIKFVGGDRVLTRYTKQPALFRACKQMRNETYTPPPLPSSWSAASIELYGELDLNRRETNEEVALLKSIYDAKDYGIQRVKKIHLRVTNIFKATLWSLSAIPYLASAEILGASLTTRAGYCVQEAVEFKVAENGFGDTFAQEAMLSDLLNRRIVWAREGSESREEFRRKLWNSLLGRRERHPAWKCIEGRMKLWLSGQPDVKDYKRFVRQERLGMR